MTRLSDLTRCFKSTTVDWNLRGRAFAKQFEVHGPPVRGVYAHLDTNSSTLPIYDKNGPGKIIVLPSTTALKSGRFVGGLPGRMLQNHDHFHRRPRNGHWQERIFADVLSCLIVLDLSHCPRESISSIETEWNRSIRATLKAKDLVHAEHRGHGESINLRRQISCAALLAILSPIASRIDP